MPMQNKTPRPYRPAFAALAAVLILSSCGGTDIEQQLGANLFLGGSVSSFSGPDGADTFAQDTARDALTGASFDLTPSGFTLSSGPVSSDSGGTFGLGSGTLGVDGDNATLDLEVSSSDPNITNVNAVGSFSLAQAQAAILNPGGSFDVDWTLSFLGAGAIPFEIGMTQTLGLHL
jgi:hypothetical protein